MSVVDSSTSPYLRPEQHIRVKDIIRSHSTNRTDVREFALAGLDLEEVRVVLDLGCGFGFMAEAVAGRVSPEARIVGVDACLANRTPFLERVWSSGREGEFIHQSITDALDLPDASFDLVTATYSLNFFPGAIPEVARVTKSEGRFIVLTHAEDAERDLLRAVADHYPDLSLRSVDRSFNDQNGGDMLAVWFDTVERRDYANVLVFEPGEHDERLAYLEFKLPLLGAEPRSPVRPGKGWSASPGAGAGAGRFTVCKNDVLYRCERPKIKNAEK